MEDKGGDARMRKKGNSPHLPQLHQPLTSEKALLEGDEQARNMKYK